MTPEQQVEYEKWMANIEAASKRMEPLHPDLLPYLNGVETEPWLYHPFVDMHCPPEMYALANHSYLTKRGILVRNLQEKKFDEYVLGHERYGLIGAIEECVDAGLRGRQYWKIVRLSWKHVHSTWGDRGKWYRAWHHKTPGRKYMMSEAERRYLASLPAEVTIYRGVTLADPDDLDLDGGQVASWTKRRNVADWFATGWRMSEGRGDHKLVLTGSVKRENILAIFANEKSESNEMEIVASKVRIVRIENASQERADAYQAHLTAAHKQFNARLKRKACLNAENVMA